MTFSFPGVRRALSLVLLALSAALASESLALQFQIGPIAVADPFKHEGSRVALSAGGQTVEGTILYPGDLVVQATGDTTDLTIREIGVSATPSEAIVNLFLETAPVQVRNVVTVSTTIDPPGFEPPYTIVETTTTDYGSLVWVAEAVFRYSVLSSDPPDLSIDPYDLTADGIRLATAEAAVDSLTLSAYVDGELRGTVAASGSYEQSAYAKFGCGGTLTEPFCLLGPTIRKFTGASGSNSTPTLTFEDVFGLPRPTNGSLNFSDGSAQVTQVPEPSTASLLSLGLVGLLSMRNRRSSLHRGDRSLILRR